MLLNAGSLSSCSGHTFTTPIISARDAVDPIPQGYPVDVRADLANQYGTQSYSVTVTHVAVYAITSHATPSSASSR